VLIEEWTIRYNSALNQYLVDENNIVNPISSLVKPYLTQQAKCLVAYKLEEAVKLDSNADNN
jgi:hypothetical protein